MLRYFLIDALFVVSQVQRSLVFRRNGSDIHSDQMISVAQAILGGTARAQGLYGAVDITVRRVYSQHTPDSSSFC